MGKTKRRRKTENPEQIWRGILDELSLNNIHLPSDMTDIPPYIEANGLATLSEDISRCCANKKLPVLQINPPDDQLSARFLEWDLDTLNNFPVAQKQFAQLSVLGQNAPAHLLTYVLVIVHDMYGFDGDYVHQLCIYMTPKEDPFDLSGAKDVVT